MDEVSPTADRASPQPPEIPTKCVFKMIDLEVNCEIKYIDFEGRSDGRSVKKIIAHVNPRKLVCCCCHSFIGFIISEIVSSSTLHKIEICYFSYSDFSAWTS
jgi:hypothetical protein